MKGCDHWITNADNELCSWVRALAVHSATAVLTGIAQRTASGYVRNGVVYATEALSTISHRKPRNRPRYGSNS